MPVSRHMTTIRQSNVPFQFFEAGRGPTKSTPIASQGSTGTGSGCSKPNGFCVFDFVCAHTVHDEQYRPTSVTNVFHQTWFRRYYNFAYAAIRVLDVSVAAFDDRLEGLPFESCCRGQAQRVG
ncbi:hypothetical protein FISHEDRAFT_55654 [Fistulina hepatica ATCC 64428]|uniref:Uncharacterized protein n=1 Tax=Fistulina hepatica ATCC 64428 TaxID=1128425 RepID=A0A0D7AQE5_9AGAR|nr:hypothetical protein FISHEDRAFT_55654 [Fistulina hepatica ATCC 64428]